MIKVKKITKNCGICRARMVVNPCNHAKQFCSYACAAEGRRKPRNPNTICSNCKKPLFKWPHQLKSAPVHFCNNECKGAWMSENLTGEKSPSWKGGKWNNRVQVLAHTSYRTWRAGILEGAKCILCGSDDKMELHHIKSRKDRPELTRNESNVIPICALCHDVFHSNSSKGGELRETLKAILAHGDPQPSQSKVVDMVGWKVQRLTGEETTTNKPDTSATPERDDIVRAYEKS